MQLLSIIASAFLASTALADAAPKVRDSPRDAVYVATFNSVISGTIQFFVQHRYVRVRVNLKGLPGQGGPFMYHVHERPVDSSGSCASTMGHFNPYRGVLNARTWALAEVGDLSGKHGLIPGTSYRKTYYDPYMSLNRRNRAFFGDLSVVVHLNDGTRIACTNIVRLLAAAPLVDGRDEGANMGAELGQEMEGVGMEEEMEIGPLDDDLFGASVFQDDDDDVDDDVDDDDDDDVDIDVSENQNDLDTAGVDNSGDVDVEDSDDEYTVLDFFTRSTESGEEDTQSVSDEGVGVSMPLAIGRRAVHIL